ncbi:hypothetical protein SDJN02_10301 [Cucurbita argyrosperma subsp. argyrosperma]|nr:hypothetical protein SDJN02_10301 [Cucurbita argyrosperma subsp. argyrosperma]
MMRRQQQRNSQSSVFYELSSLAMNILRSPPSSIPFSDHSPVVPTQMTPAGFASLLLGMSLALMLCGSVTFFIGFMMMPWVIGLVMFFFVAAVVSSLFMIGRSILYYVTAQPAPRKDIPGRSGPVPCFCAHQALTNSDAHQALKLPPDVPILYYY